METNNNQFNFGQLSSTISNVGKAFILSRTWKIILVLLAGIVGIGLWIYYAGKKAAKRESIDYNQLPIPNSQATTQQEKQEFIEWMKGEGTRLADSLYDQLGFTFTNFELDRLITQCLALSDQKLTGLNNIYNTKYAAKDRRLYPDLKSKFYLFSWDGDDEGRDALVLRLEKLNAR